jgi:hypothetical protein
MSEERIEPGTFEPAKVNPAKLNRAFRKSRRKGFDPLRVFSGPMFEQRMTSAELALMPQLGRDEADLEAPKPAVGAAPRPAIMEGNG